MIFVTVGTQLPFPRLLNEMNEIAGRILEPVIAQTAENGNYPNLIVEPFMSAERYAQVLQRARLVVAHAGIGTIMAARDACRPLVLVPRQAKLGEHRNDHQAATIRELVGRNGITAIWNTKDLHSVVQRNLTPPSSAPAPALDSLVAELRSFIA